jgi:hypothetical protein
VYEYDLDVADVAKRLNMSQDRVRRCARQLGGVRIAPGGRWRFSWARVEMALREGGQGRIEGSAGPGRLQT